MSHMLDEHRVSFDNRREEKGGDFKVFPTLIMTTAAAARMVRGKEEGKLNFPHFLFQESFV